MSQISVSDMSFYYDGSYEDIFSHVSFQIDTDWKLGFVGRNGRGKTTFFKLLMDEYEYTGSISTPVTFEYFPYQIEDKKQSGVDIIEAIDPGYEFWKVCRELNLLEVDPGILYRPFDTLSNGEQTKVMLGVLFAKENAFLLIDEPANHLDILGRETVMQYLKKKKGFILVSHDRRFLDGCVDHILAINKMNIEVIQGDFSSWRAQKQRQDAHEHAENEKLKKEVFRLTKSAQQAGNWSDQAEGSKFHTRVAGLRVDRGFMGHKSAKIMKRSSAAEKRAQTALEDKKNLLKNIETADQLKLFPLRHHKEILAQLEDVALSYGENEVCSNISFTVRQGECIALQGKNGCGKSSILKLIMGEQIAYSGVVELAGGLKISHVPQDTSHLKGGLQDWIHACGADERLFKALLRKLDFERSHFEKPLESYSDGQKKKVLIAGSLCEQAHLYIWDEPLNFIDIFSRMQIEELIKEFKPTILLVEHDRAFIEEIGARPIDI